MSPKSNTSIDSSIASPIASPVESSNAPNTTPSAISNNNWGKVNKSGMQLSGFTQMDNALFREITNNIDISTAGIYFLLLSHRNTITNECFPTYSTLGRESNLSAAYINKIIKLLIKYNYVHTVPGNSHIATRYFFPKEKFYKKEEDLSLTIEHIQKNTIDKINSNKKSTKQNKSDKQNKQNKSDKQNKSTSPDNKNSIDEELERAFDGLPD